MHKRLAEAAERTQIPLHSLTLHAWSNKPTHTSTRTEFTAEIYERLDAKAEKALIWKLCEGL